MHVQFPLQGLAAKQVPQYLVQGHQLPLSIVSSRMAAMHVPYQQDRAGHFHLHNIRLLPQAAKTRPGSAGLDSRLL